MRSSPECDSQFHSFFVGTIMAVGLPWGRELVIRHRDSRRREMATRERSDSSGSAVVVSVLIRSMLLALPGAVLGTLAAWLLFNDLAASPFGFSFQLSVTPPLQ